VAKGALSRFSAYLKSVALKIFGQAESEARESVGHSVNVDAQPAGSVTHQFAFGSDAEDQLSYAVNVSQIDVTSGLNHQLNVSEINDFEQDLNHQFNVHQINDFEQDVGHQLNLLGDASGFLVHQLGVVFRASSGLSHEFTVSGIHTTANINHQFNMNIDRDNLSHQFSAIGVGIDETSLSHQLDVTVNLPSYVLTHQFYVEQFLDIEGVTISGDYRIVPEGGTQTVSGVSESLLGIDGTRYSYADPAVNNITSTGTWFGIDSSQVNPTVASGLSEADFLFGSFVFENEPENLIAGSGLWSTAQGFLTLPEHNFDVLVDNQAWQLPVIKTGVSGWRGLNDFNASLPNMLVEPGENPFDAFFGRQETISGVLQEIVGFFGVFETTVFPGNQDPAALIGPTPTLIEVNDPLEFSEGNILGQVFFPLDRDFLISGIYITNTSGGGLSVSDNTVRLGFTLGEANPQPSLLEFNLGVNTPSGVYDQTQDTNQWLAGGLFRDFNTAPLQPGDNVRGQIRVFEPKNSTDFTPPVPSGLAQMASDDGVNLLTAGNLIWPDFEDTEVTLDLLVEILASLNRSTLPHGISLQAMAKNRRGQIIKLYVDGTTNEIRATLENIPGVFADGATQGTLILKRDATISPVVTATNLSNRSIVVVNQEEKNQPGRYVIIDEEGS